MPLYGPGSDHSLGFVVEQLRTAWWREAEADSIASCFTYTRFVSTIRMLKSVERESKLLANLPLPSH